jgi:type II secretory pathway component GspD/PulD (secretin)
LLKRLSVYISILSFIIFCLLVFDRITLINAEEPPQTQPQEQPASDQPQPQPPEPEKQILPQVQPQQEIIEQQKPPEQQPIKPPPVKQSPKKRGEVSFNFDDADVFSVIQTIFGEVLRVNYIIDPQVKGRVNFRSVAPVPVEDVLPLMEVILRLNGIGVVEEAGLYRIIPIGELSKEPAPVGLGREAEKIPVTGKALLQVVPIQYIESSEMVRILTPFLSKNALIVDVPKTNHIIAVDTDANVKRLVQLIELFDSEQLKKIKPQVFIYPVQNSKAKTVADMLNQIFLGARPTTPSTTPTTPTAPRTPAPSQPPSVQQSVISTGLERGGILVSEATRIFPDEVTNTIIILATPEDYELIAETIKKIDIVPRQVVIEGLIAQVDLTDELSFGISWSLRTDITIKGLKPFERDINLSGEMGQNPSDLIGIDPTAPLSGTGFTFVGTDPSGVVRALIRALVRDSKAKLLAAPHILVSDNREARIQVGQQVPIVTSETIATPAVPAQRTIQYKDIGIILDVKPQVNEGGLVSLELKQEISDYFTETLYTDSKEIVLRKTEASTNLVVQDGQTIIIGGLIRETTDKSRTGIPLLSKIPILGYLFGSTSTTSKKTELIILLTPHVIRTQQEAKDVTSDYLNRYKDSTKDKKIDKFIKDDEQKKEKNDQGRGDDKDKASENILP